MNASTIGAALTAAALLGGSPATLASPEQDRAEVHDAQQEHQEDQQDERELDDRRTVLGVLQLWLRIVTTMSLKV